MLHLAIERFGSDALPKPHRLGDAAWVGNRLAEMLPMTPERRQCLLEISDPLDLLQRISEILHEPPDVDSI
jgi:Lon protease-like protein